MFEGGEPSNQREHSGEQEHQAEEIDLSEASLPKRSSAPRGRFKSFVKSQTSFSLPRTAAGVAILGGLFFGGNHIRRSWNEILLQDSSIKLVTPSWFEAETWPENTKVFASSLQSMDSYFYYSYTQQLAENIASGRYDTVEGAHEDLETGMRGVFRIQPQLPTSSSKRVQGWDIEEEKERHVVVITGKEVETDLRNLLSPDEEEVFRRQSERLVSALKSQYDVPERNIHRLHQGTVEELELLMRELQEIDPEAELLIYINAHGASLENTAFPEELRERQGAYDGYIWLDEDEAFSEEDMQDLMREYTAHLSSVFLVIDACQSGAWTATRANDPNSVEESAGPDEELPSPTRESP